jgi:subtilisin-like proprotein convertase family protein
VYSSIDTPLSIPDNNATGVSSNIAVPEDLTIANLSVTLNISHPRPSDLQASLIGPNSAVVPLPILNGINDIAAFNGTSSQGTWTVKVVDSVNKKTGTLNGWTLTIE